MNIPYEYYIHNDPQTSIVRHHYTYDDPKHCSLPQQAHTEDTDTDDEDPNMTAFDKMLQEKDKARARVLNFNGDDGEEGHGEGGRGKWRKGGKFALDKNGRKIKSGSMKIKDTAAALARQRSKYVY